MIHFVRYIEFVWKNIFCDLEFFIGNTFIDVVFKKWR
jgi:hypothetical protein